MNTYKHNNNCQIPKNIYIDIDHTICYYKNSTIDYDYNEAIPDFNKIKIVNTLYDKGHSITMWTARGMKTGIDWRSITETQLKNWGVKYHKLRLDKPPYDMFIDDKALNNLDQVNLVLMMDT